MDNREPLERGGAWTVLSVDSGQAWCCASQDVARWKSWLARLPEAVASKGVREIRHSSHCSTGRKTFRVAGPQNLPVVVKRYPGSSLTKLPSPDAASAANSPWEAFCAQAALWNYGAPVAQPLAFFEPSQGSPSAECWAVSGAVEDCQPLFDYAFDLFRRRACGVGGPQCVRSVAEAVAALHRTGYAHGDLHNQNILAQNRDGVFRGVVLIDFDACAYCGQTPCARAQLLDLAALAASLHGIVPAKLLIEGLRRYLEINPPPGGVRSPVFRFLIEEYRAHLDRYTAARDRNVAFFLEQALQALQTLNDSN